MFRTKTVGDQPEDLQDAEDHPSEPGPSTSAVQEAEMYFLHEDNTKLKNQLTSGKGKLSFEGISGSDVLVFQYTGLPSVEHFNVLSSALKGFH